MNHALLLVDLQEDYLAAEGLQPAADILIARAAALLDGCRKRRVPIIHIWTTVHRDNDRRLPHWRQANRWQCVSGTAGRQPPEPLRALDGEAIAHKTGFNAFADAALEATLRGLQCDRVILAGLHLHACVRAVAVECLERGYRVCVTDDAVADNDPIHAAATRRWLAERCVEFAPVSAVLASLDGGAPPTLVHRSPRCTGQVLFEIPIPATSDIAAATARARNSWVEWRRTPMQFRLDLLERVANRLDAAAAELARQMATEIGKPIAHGLEETRRAAVSVRDVAARAAQFEPQKRQTAGRIRYQPLGVVAIISPWNNPVAIPVGKIAPALAYGNTAVWKPAPAATGISQAVMRLLYECGVTADAVQLLTGDHTTAQQLAAQQDVDAVTFTGSSLAGYSVQEICARRAVPLQAELSGNNAAVVWDDADLRHAAEQVAWGAFGFAGQRCTSNRRVIVRAACYEDFLRELRAASEKLVWGDPLEEATDIGPVIDLSKRDDTVALVARAQTDGAAHHVELFQKARAREPWVSGGAYSQPVIVGCDQPAHPLVQEETMSPLLVVQRADNFEHTLALCNGVRHGLVASLFSNARELQERFLEEARAGILKFNASTAGVDVSLPFGGWKASGIGPPEHGESDQLFYTRTQAVYGGNDDVWSVANGADD
jgi:acyl-CoA reductase-like NAD-dependent aldehyde dehydrogenase/nicotinamidase-related amidase